jgi:hypothetical protein
MYYSTGVPGNQIEPVRVGIMQARLYALTARSLGPGLQYPVPTTHYPLPTTQYPVPTSRIPYAVRSSDQVQDIGGL